eukprot:1047243-Rhodomonas_salina.1
METCFSLSFSSIAARLLSAAATSAAVLGPVGRFCTGGGMGRCSPGVFAPPPPAPFCPGTPPPA